MARSVYPILRYADAKAAIDFLTTAFGFTERLRMPDEEGRVTHAEVELGDGVVMFGTPESHKTPKELGGTTQSIYVYVDDVDAHYEHAKAAGAEIIRDPEDQFYGDRNYGARDPEGHEWLFGTHVRDVSPEEMQSALTGAQSS